MNYIFLKAIKACSKPSWLELRFGGSFGGSFGGRVVLLWIVDESYC